MPIILLEQFPFSFPKTDAQSVTIGQRQGQTALQNVCHDDRLQILELLTLTNGNIRVNQLLYLPKDK